MLMGYLFITNVYKHFVHSKAKEMVFKAVQLLVV